MFEIKFSIITIFLFSTIFKKGPINKDSQTKLNEKRRHIKLDKNSEDRKSISENPDLPNQKIFSIDISVIAKLHS